MTLNNAWKAGAAAVPVEDLAVKVGFGVKTAGLFSKARARRVRRQSGGKVAAMQSRNYP